MARLRPSIYIVLAALLFAVPSFTFAAGFFGPVLPQSGSCFCNGGPLDWGCVLQVLQNLIQLAVSLGVIMCVIWIAYAGFSLMVSGGNPQGLTKAKTRIFNAVIGIIVILCAWLVVDFVMKTIYNPAATFEGGTFGPWNSILVSNGSDYCILAHNPVAISVGDVAFSIPFGTSAPGGGGISSGAGQVGSGGRGTAMCAEGNTACSVQALMAQGLTQAQAQTMSCIAVTESGGTPNGPDSSTGACGTFQITNRPGNWHNPIYHQGNCSVNTSCNNAGCNLQTAVLMFRRSGYQPWTCPGCNAAAHSCVAHYDPGH